MRARFACGARAAHCRIAAIESLPTTSVAHAVSVRTTASACRRPRFARRSGTCRNLLASADSAGVDVEPGLRQGEVRELANGRVNQRRYRHERGSCDDLLA